MSDYEVIKQASNDMYLIYENGRYVAKQDGGGAFYFKWNAVRRAKKMASGAYEPYRTVWSSSEAQGDRRRQ